MLALQLAWLDIGEGIEQTRRVDGKVVQANEEDNTVRDGACEIRNNIYGEPLGSV